MKKSGVKRKKKVPKTRYRSVEENTGNRNRSIDQAFDFLFEESLKTNGEAAQLDVNEKKGNDSAMTQERGQIQSQEPIQNGKCSLLYKYKKPLC